MIDPVKNHPGYLLRRISAAFMAKLAKRLEVLDLRPTEATVLTVIDANPNATQSEIGRLLEIASANMAPLVSRLESRKLIERQAVDGRSHGLSLTANGRKLAQRVKKTVTEHEEELLAKVPSSLRSGFVNALAAIWAEEIEK